MDEMSHATQNKNKPEPGYDSDLLAYAMHDLEGHKWKHSIITKNNDSLHAVHIQSNGDGLRTGLHFGKSPFRPPPVLSRCRGVLMIFAPHPLLFNFESCRQLYNNNRGL
ncbi:hypothetical protein ABID49_000749 [Bhargavaea ullalensis]|uniref:Uncharacterized protein n=1 Tax=Bhargavaea ullalensis TaxID=1265685 RepID=A0ABV2G9W2_9BACL